MCFRLQERNHAATHMKAKYLREIIKSNFEIVIHNVFMNQRSTDDHAHIRLDMPPGAKRTLLRANPTMTFQDIF